MKGAMNKQYNIDRKTKIAPKYRLKRRTREVIKAIKRHLSQPKKILDIGTADGLMLGQIKKTFPKSECIGLEYSEELINACNDKNIKIIQGDAQSLPFKNNEFDIITATAVIEHLEKPVQMIKESYRCLKPEGILIITTPVPLFEKLAQKIGHLKDGYHQKTFNLVELKNYLEKTNFEISEQKKFMLSPVGYPFIWLEEVIRFLGLDFILLNQLIVGRK